jgi:light-regulated signal transduction histidine kinase (bacteriophytochrome)
VAIDELRYVTADRDRVEQILTNLIENGAKYATVDRLRVDAYADESSAFVAVSDEGPGIPPDELESVFTKFYRREVPSPRAPGWGCGSAATSPKPTAAPSWHRATSAAERHSPCVCHSSETGARPPKRRAL